MIIKFIKETIMTNYTISDARYAKAKKSVQIVNDSGYKSETCYMIEALGARWSNREKAYIASPRQASNMVLLLEAGYTVVSCMDKNLYKPNSHDKISIKEGLKAIKNA
jgi:hypothetical protein